MKRRGAGEVIGIDSDDRYLEQARFAATEVLGFDACRVPQPVRL
jgi:tRNA (mo5U34)-methyltransferase